MRVLLLNPPHPAVSSRCHDGRMPPLGLLAVGGPLIDAGHEVRLLDAEFGPLPTVEIVSSAGQWRPDAVFIGHGGSTSAHPVIVKIACALKEAMPRAWLVYGGVYPTYHAGEILSAHRVVDVIVRGEGEATSPRLLAAIESGASLDTIPGLAIRTNGTVHLTPPAAPIHDLDAYRVGWELIDDWQCYQYWGAGRAAVVQFSRGCPHHCTYCGQRGFWTRWRHRDPARTAAEIGWLYRTQGVGFIDLADENPTSSQRLWRQFLEALIRENVSVQLVATIRAGDIVRDADILHLYKKAGFSRILMGVETTDAGTQARIQKAATTATDRQAVQLLREHDILSQVAHVVGFEGGGVTSVMHGQGRVTSTDLSGISVTPWHRRIGAARAKLAIDFQE
jgi:anaerobic magnesium-protoporphyrin IX monomethyl ester cyclase